MSPFVTGTIRFWKLVSMEQGELSDRSGDLALPVSHALDHESIALAFNHPRDGYAQEGARQRRRLPKDPFIDQRFGGLRA